MREPRLLTAADLRIGLHAEFARDITSEDVSAFADLSHDWNPLHTDEEYARHTNYGERIVHGAFQVALASAMAGMYLPGREVVVGAFQCRFPAPLHYPSRVRVQGEITAWSPQSGGGSLRVRVTEIPAGVLTSEIHVGFSLHETRMIPQDESKPEVLDLQRQQPAGKPIVLLTGAGGGLGRRIVAVLSESYYVVGLVRSRPKQIEGGMEWVAADLAASDWESAAERQLNGRRLHGLVHAAWPPGPQGGILEAEIDAINIQLEFGGVGTVRVARFLRAHAAGGGARLVVLGSVAATVRPALNMAAYSLGKAALEHTVRLLAPELARSNITINTIAPSFVPIGMNDAKTNRAVLTETAKVPLGRLCSPEDVARAVDFFLSPGAAFITGQMLPLTGGQL
jgi:NAD(P)-dependent dehydrogenase (short-subunit alcohol dehydrogenase family)/acyl dehydratase